MNEDKNVYMDDSVDIGKEPLELDNAEAQAFHEEIMKMYKRK